MKKMKPFSFDLTLILLLLLLLLLNPVLHPLHYSNPLRHVKGEVLRWTLRGGKLQIISLHMHTVQ